MAPGTEGRQDIVAEAQDVVEPQRHVLLVGDAHLVHERLRARRCGLSRLRAGTAAGSAARVLASAGVTPAGAGPAPWVPRAAEDAASGGGGAATGQQPAGTLSKPAGNGETASLAAFLLHLTRGGGQRGGAAGAAPMGGSTKGGGGGWLCFLIETASVPTQALVHQTETRHPDRHRPDRQTGHRRVASPGEGTPPAFLPSLHRKHRLLSLIPPCSPVRAFPSHLTAPPTAQLTKEVPCPKTAAPSQEPHFPPERPVCGLPPGSSATLRRRQPGTHPIQAAQVLHPVLVPVLVVIDDGVLLVNAAGLGDTEDSGGPQLSKAQEAEAPPAGGPAVPPQLPRRLGSWAS